MRNVELPFDLLGVIFHYHVISKGPLELRTVLFVAPSWYIAAIHHPHLWTMIHINRYVFEYFEQRQSHSDARTFFRQCLARSGAMSIQLTLTFIPSPTQEKLWSEMVSVIKDEKWAVMRRCEKLHWLYDDRTPFSRLDICLSPRLDGLRTLCIEGLDGIFPERLLFPEVPFLEELRLWNHMTPAPFFKQFDLKKLWLSNDGLWTRDDLAAIHHFRAVRWLTLESLCDVNTFDEPVYKQIPLLDWVIRPVQLECLETLELIGMIPKKFLGDLHAPNLVNLLVFAQRDGLHALGELPGCTVHKNVQALRVNLDQKQMDSWKPKYGALLAEMPNLQVTQLNGVEQEDNERGVREMSVMSLDNGTMY